MDISMSRFLTLSTQSYGALGGLYQIAEDAYVRKIAEFQTVLRNYNLEFIANLVATLFIEPINTFKAAYLMTQDLSLKQYSNLNPKQLDQKQAQYAPVLLIHGDCSASGIFSNIIDRLREENPNRPIFTVDLVSSDGKVSEKDHLGILIEKIHEIVSLYSITPKVTLIGHSSGGDVIAPLAKRLAKTHPPILGTLIKIGSILKEQEAKEFECYPHGNVLEIVGTKDVFEGSNSYLKNKLVVNCGHLTLLFKDVVLDRICWEVSN